MRYDYKLEYNEHYGINYHRVIAEYIIQKLSSQKFISLLLVGESDMLVTYLISRSGKSIHLWGDFDVRLPRVRVVSEEDFDFMEYDAVIGLFCDTPFIEKCVSQGVNFILIPNMMKYSTTDIISETRDILHTHGCSYSVHAFDTASYSKGYFAFTNI